MIPGRRLPIRCAFNGRGYYQISSLHRGYQALSKILCFMAALVSDAISQPDLSLFGLLALSFFDGLSTTSLMTSHKDT